MKEKGDSLGLPKLDLRLGDCIVEMKNIPDNSVDMVLADLP